VGGVSVDVVQILRVSRNKVVEKIRFSSSSRVAGGLLSFFFQSADDPNDPNAPIPLIKHWIVARIILDSIVFAADAKTAFWQTAFDSICHDLAFLTDLVVLFFASFFYYYITRKRGWNKAAQSPTAARPTACQKKDER
jgi:hypothetical protein